MNTYRFEHRGHKIQVTTVEVKAGRWAWRYVIDDRIEQAYSGIPMPDEEAVREEGETESMLAADRLDADRH